MDRKPARFQCLREAEGLYPPLYDLWHCPRCHYTAHNRIFPNPLKDIMVGKGFVQNHLSAVARDQPGFRRICEALGKDLSVEHIDFGSAIQKALLAIHFEQFISDLLKQNLAGLARGLLRVAWLYRDWPDKDPDYAATHERMKELMDVVASDWPDVPRNEDLALQQACTWYQKALDEPAVSADPLEATSILLHMARIQLQRGDATEAGALLSTCRRDVMDYISEATRVLKEDDAQRRMQKSEREQWVTRSRKLRSALDDIEQLQEQRKKIATA